MDTSAYVGHIGYGEKQADMVEVAVVEPSRVDDQLPRRSVWPIQVNLVGIDTCTAGCGRRQQ
jgi:hypothetical protein